MQRHHRLLLSSQVLRAQQRQYLGENEDPVGFNPQDAESSVQTPVGHGGSAIRITEYVGQHCGHEQYMRARP